MTKILYIKKKDTTKNWSTVLYRQYKDFKSLSENYVGLHEVDTSSLRTYLHEPLKVYKKIRDNKIDVIYVNHFICAFPFILISPLIRSKKKILALHESESVLGLNFLFKYKNKLSWKEKFRYFPVIKLPAFFFDHIFVLNKEQINFKWIKRDRFKQINFLGINTGYDLSNKPQKPKYDVFFPHDPKRIEKGYLYFRKAISLLDPNGLNLNIILGGDFLHGEMLSKYQESDVIVLCGYYETYSIVFLEAATCNKKMVVNRNIGIIQNIIDEKGVDYLVEKGVFVSDFDEESLSINIGKALLFPHEKAKSKEIITDFNLSEKEVNKNLLKEIVTLTKKNFTEQ